MSRHCRVSAHRRGEGRERNSHPYKALGRTTVRHRREAKGAGTGSCWRRRPVSSAVSTRDPKCIEEATRSQAPSSTPTTRKVARRGRASSTSRSVMRNDCWAEPARLHQSWVLGRFMVMPRRSHQSTKPCTSCVTSAKERATSETSSAQLPEATLKPSSTCTPQPWAAAHR